MFSSELLSCINDHKVYRKPNLMIQILPNFGNSMGNFILGKFEQKEELNEMCSLQAFANEYFHLLILEILFASVRISVVLVS